MIARRIGAFATAVALTSGVALAVAAPAAAESVSDLQVQATVNADTSLHIVETITYDFGGEYRHGIYRDIPVADQTLLGKRRQYQIDVHSVTVDGAPAQVDVTENDPFINIRIGDPNVTITGAHTYTIDYTVQDALRVLTTEDLEDPLMPAGLSVGDVELYWDFVGTGWDVPIHSARAGVTGPADVLSAKCYSGPAGSTDPCPVAVASAVAALGPVSLGAGDALTGAIVYPRAAFTRTPFENISQGLPSNPALGVVGALIPAALLVFVPVGLAVSRRSTDKGSALPLAPPQYSPPDDLSPAEMAAAWQGRKLSASPRPLVATLLDLAVRRWVNVGLLHDDLNVAWTGMGSPPLKPWEEGLTAQVLKGQPNATLSGYDAELSKGWTSSFRDLVDEAETNGRRNPKGDDPDKRWNILILLVVLLAGAGFIVAWIGSAFIAAILFTMAVGALVGFIAARIITPRSETPQSARFLAEVEGFKKVLGTEASASRREFAQRLGLPPEAIFATMLPYAVVFDLEKSWMAAFPDLTAPQLQAYGYSALSMSSIDNIVSAGTTSVSSAMTAPSSGSGGGGSSGGGGGGGGGGSW